MALIELRHVSKRFGRLVVLNHMSLNIEAGKCIVVTHDMNSALKVADRIVMLHKGKIIFDGTPEQIKATEDPVVRRFVLGEASEEELASLRQTV